MEALSQKFRDKEEFFFVCWDLKLIDFFHGFPANVNFSWVRLKVSLIVIMNILAGQFYSISKRCWRLSVPSMAFEWNPNFLPHWFWHFLPYWNWLFNPCRHLLFLDLFFPHELLFCRPFLLLFNSEGLNFFLRISKFIVDIFKYYKNWKLTSCQICCFCFTQICFLTGFHTWIHSSFQSSFFSVLWASTLSVL